MGGCEELLNFPHLDPCPWHWSWTRINIDWQLICRVESTSWVPFWSETLPFWCVSQNFTRLIWDWYSLWPSWILTGIWTWIVPEGSDIFWNLASCCHQVYCGNTTWVKSKIAWLGGISLASHTCGEYFRVLFNVSVTSLWDVPCFSLVIHDCCMSLCGVSYSPWEGWVQLALPLVQSR